MATESSTQDRLNKVLARPIDRQQKVPPMNQRPLNKYSPSFLVKQVLERPFDLTGRNKVPPMNQRPLNKYSSSFLVKQVLERPFTLTDSNIVLHPWTKDPYDKSATTNVRRLGSSKNCPYKNMVIVGPYLTYYDILSKRVFKTYLYIMPHLFDL